MTNTGTTRSQSGTTINLSDLVKPTERQREFLKAVDSHKYVLYGGSKGAGKSYILRWTLIKLLLKWASEGHLKVRVGLFCEDYPALKDRQVTKIKEEFPSWLGTLSDNNVQGMSFVLHDSFGGGIIALRNLDDPSKFASSEFAAIAIDELTKNERKVLDQMRSIIRWPSINNTKLIAGTNPGEIGHEWVKKLFIDRKFGPEDPEPSQVAFVKALPTDNPNLSPAYIEELRKLPEKDRKKYLEGNWDVYEGQFFDEWDYNVHTCERFEIPENWVRIRGIDPSGRSGTTSSHLYAINEDGTVYVTHEHYESGLDVDQHAEEISRIGEGIDLIYTVIDSSAFSKLGLPETTAEIYERHGVTGLIPASKNRVEGWNAVHQYLRWEEKIKPKLIIFRNCVNMLRTIPLAIHDINKPEDISTKWMGAEHNDALDELRYVIQTLREQKSPTVLNTVEKHIEAIKKKERMAQYNYSYFRK